MYKDLNIDINSSFAVKEEQFLKAVKKYPKAKDEFYNQLALFGAMAKEYDKAEMYANKAIESAKNDIAKAEHYSVLSTVYDWQEKTKEAIVWLEKSVELNPNVGEMVGRLGQLYMNEKDYHNVVKVFGRLMMVKETEDELNEWFFNYYEMWGDLYSEKKSYKKASKLYDKLLTEMNEPRDRAVIFSLLSDMYKNSSDPKAAIANAEKAVELWPENDRLINTLAELCITAKDYDKAKAALDLLLPLDKKTKNKENHYSLNYYLWLGRLYYTMNKVEDAIAAFEKRLTLHKDPKESYETLEQLSALHFHQRQYKKALPYLKKIIKLWPKQYPRAYASLATYYFKEKLDPENALNYLMLAKEANYMHDDFLKGNDHEVAGSIYASIGEIYYKEYHDMEQAIDQFEKALACGKMEKKLEGAVCDYLYEIYKMRGDEEKANEYKERRSGLKVVLDLFSGDWTPPPKKTLDERLRNPKNKKGQIEKLPYYYKNLPDDYMEKHHFLKKLRYDFENDLLTNPKYKEFFDKHEPYHNRGFIHRYVEHKISLVEYPEWYLDEQDGLKEKSLVRDMESVLNCILQKKLFNMQLLWRAGQLDIPGLKTTCDFELWEKKIFMCPFVEEITPEEIELMREFLLNPETEEDVTDYFTDWQNYDGLTDKNEEGNMEYMPDWYEFYDNRMNTGPLLTLPNTKGEKEEQYVQIYYEWKRRQPPEKVEPQEPYVPPKDFLFGNEETYTSFMEEFEDDYLCRLHSNWMKQNEFPDAEYDKDAVKDAMYILEYAEEPVMMEGGMPWHKAIIITARRYKNKRLADNLDEAYGDYKMKRELSLYHEEKEDINDFMEQRMEDRIEQVLKARELLGEPRDFNY